MAIRPDLGDVSQGKLLSIKNYYDIMHGILTPVQMEGLRLLLTPFPQQQFNQTDDRKVEEPSLGVSCLDCHANGHTNGAFHLNPDTRPHIARLRLDTVSLRGMYNQQIHGSKRSLRSVEDFTEFEQRTAYFDGDHVTAAKKGANLPDRTSQVSLMAQMQNMLDFPPSAGSQADGVRQTRSGSGQRAGDAGSGNLLRQGPVRCLPSGPVLPGRQDARPEGAAILQAADVKRQVHHRGGSHQDFHTERPQGFPPYMHDGRLLTLEDTVEFFNIVTDLNLTQKEKEALVAFMRQL
jgi:hypothetical protein